LIVFEWQTFTKEILKKGYFVNMHHNFSPCTGMDHSRIIYQGQKIYKLL